MLKWCKDLRIGEGVKRADKIRRKLNHGKNVPGVLSLFQKIHGTFWRSYRL